MHFRIMRADRGYRSDYLWLPLAKLRNLAAIKNSLTFPQDQKAPIHAYHMTKNHIIVPREYIPYDQWETLDFVIEDRTPESFPRVDAYSGTKLRDAVQTTAYSSLLEHGSGILSLSCGKGKTVVSLKAWVKTGVPALVVVHTKELRNQWVERIIEHTSLTEDEVGTYQGKVEDWEKPICVAMIQTLASRVQSGDLPEGFEDHFGVVIYDEVHHLGAPYFNTTAALGKGLRWGLSATPDRDDGLDALYQYHLGGIVYQNLDHDIIPDTYFIRTGTHIPPNVWPELRDRTGEVSIPKLLTWLGEDVKRNEKIIETLDAALEKNRKVLALSSRVDHLNALHSVYPDAGKIHGKVSDKNREGVLYNHDLVFATTSLAKEGLDRKDLDTVALLLPITKEGMFRQILGRIQRESDGKNQPVMIVFEDNNVPICVNMCRKLRHILTNLNYPFYLTDE